MWFNPGFKKRGSGIEEEMFSEIVPFLMIFIFQEVDWNDKSS
jgi:hypothetical protein